MGIRDHDRAFKKSRFLNPSCASHLAITVERIPSCEHWLVDALLTAGENSGDSGAYRAFANDELPFSRDERSKTDFDTGYVGDGVERAGHAVEGNAEIASTRLVLSVREGGEQEHQRQC
jgi:hypothetical protein